MKIQQDFVKQSKDYIKLYGFSNETLEKISLEKFNDANYASKIFKNLADFTKFYLQEENKLYLKELNKISIKDKKVSKLIFDAILLKIKLIDKEILSQLLKYIAKNPNKTVISFDSLYRLSDSIWNWLEDNDIDFSYYSKRISLSCIISATMLFYLANDDMIKVENFVLKQLDAISNIAKIKNKFKNYFCNKS